MSFEQSHPRVHISRWTDALRACKETLVSHPDAETITFFYENASLNDEAHSTLINALAFEKILAVEPGSSLGVVLGAENEAPARPVAKITSHISVFKTELLNNYLEQIEKKLGLEVTPTDLSIYLNQLGFSSIAVGVPGAPLSSSSESLREQPAREWDAYIDHVANRWQSSPHELLRNLKELLAQPHETSLLIDARGVPPVMNGTARNVTSFIELLDQQLQQHASAWNVSIIIPEESRTALNIYSSHITWITPEDQIEQRFDLGLNLTPVSTLDQCILMSTFCSRWVVLHLDIISLRGLQFLSQNTQASSAVNFYLEHADLVVFISEFSRMDVHNYFGEIPSLNSRSIVIRQGTDFAPTDEAHAESIDPYVLVLGNEYPHKQVELAAAGIEQAGFSVKTLTHRFSSGDQSSASQSQPLSDEQLRQLMIQASVIVFPSIYEGYGLPVAEAAALNKPLILWDTSVSREISRDLNTENINTFCSSVEEIVSAVASQLNSAESPQSITEVRTLKAFNEELVSEVESTLKSPPNTTLVNHRIHQVAYFAEIASDVERKVTKRISEQHWRTRLAKKFK